MPDVQIQEPSLHIIQEGRLYLLEDMASHPSFDRNAGYWTKNAYAERANEKGQSLMKRESYFLAEFYYAVMLDTTLTYEKSSGKNFNKGYFYTNLGICQIVNGKFSHGIANLLTAEIEDKPINSPNYNILNEVLWTQFEANEIYPFIQTSLKNTIDKSNFLIDEHFLNSFFRDMEKQDKIFCEGTLMDLQMNKAQYDHQPNAYTLGRLYSGLKDLCLITETILRKKQIAIGKINIGDLSTMHTLLENPVLTAIGISFQKHRANNNANNPQEFLNNIEYFLSLPDPVEKRYFILRLVRNFMGHHFEASETITSTSSKTFFADYYDDVLANILAAMMYLKYDNFI